MSDEKEKRAIFAERLRKAASAHYKVSAPGYGLVSLIATDMDVSNQSTSKWLKGKSLPEPERRGVLAAKLGVPTTWLFGDSHDLPEKLARLPDEDLEVASRAMAIVHPLVQRLKPDVDQETLDRLFRHAYQQLKAGQPERSVSGEIASELL